jgi:DNA polymerase-3 subunit delta
VKLAGAAAARFFARPEAGRAGLLIHGQDAMRVALRRQQVIASLIGPEGEAEMRLARLSAADLRRDGSALSDAMRATGFFPGPRVVFLEDAGEGAAEAVAHALGDWRAGDAMLVVTAGSLTKASKLKALFEDHPNAFAAAIFDDPPSREEVEGILRAAGLSDVPGPVMADIMALSAALDPGEFRQTVERIALYKGNDPGPLSADDLSACQPASLAAEVDDVLDAAAEAETGRIGPLMARLAGQGVSPTAIAIAALRHFRALHTASCDRGGVAAGVARLRPPVWGQRRDRMIRQAQRWTVARLEEAIRMIVETDLALRSSSRAPGFAVMERALIRLTMLMRD